MGHNLEQLGTASLDTFGGLITGANPSDLPEGASPRCWDVDFITGSVFTRAGLASVYTFTQVLTITQVTIQSSSTATFTYTGSITPTVNEGFLLSGFTGNANFLNGQTIYVASVNTLLSTFTTEVSSTVTQTFTNQNGTATSITGSFVGPNAPTQEATSGSGNAWTSPSSILGNTTYASVQTGSEITLPVIPALTGSFTVTGATVFWSNTPNIITTSSNATITLSSGQVQDPVSAWHSATTIPSNATILGVRVDLKANSTKSLGTALQVQLMNQVTGVRYGAVQTIPLSTTSAAYHVGSDAYTWGTTLTPALLSGNSLGVTITAVTNGTSTSFAVNSLVITVYYSLGGSTQVLTTSGFAYAVPLNAGITGFIPTFQAYTSNASTVILQLVRNGIAVGNAQTQALTTTPTIYSLGAENDLWGYTWTADDINNTDFGIQVTASGEGTTFINDLDLLVYITPAQVNFNYIKSYVQNNGQTYTLALDASGILWREDVNNQPGVLAVALSGLLPGSFAKSATMNNREHIMFSDLSIGTDRPRVYNGSTFRPLSQIGPGAPPAFASATNNTAAVLDVTDYSITTDVVTFTFTAGTTPLIGALYTVDFTGNANIDGNTFSVVGVPAPSTTQFSAAIDAPNASASGLSAKASPTSFYNVVSITQDATLPNIVPVGNAESFNNQIALWSAGPGQTTPGFTYTLYYYGVPAQENAGLKKLLAKYATYVYITNAPFGNGTQLITGATTGVPPSETGMVPYMTMTTTTSGYQKVGGPHTNGNLGTFQLTMATVETSVPIPNLGPGGQITIQGASPSAWNNTWTVVAALNSGVYNISGSRMTSTPGVAEFQYSNASTEGLANVVVGQTVQLQGLTNNVDYNTIGVITATPSSSTFQVSGFSGAIAAQANFVPENGQAVTFGTQFLIDPGFVYYGTQTNPILGDTVTPGTVNVIGGSPISVGSGIRQGTVYFITDNEYETQPAAPLEFTTPEGTNQIVVTAIPIGPPNVVARALAFTEAGQNGIPGANFYVIEQPVTTNVDGQPITIKSTIIQDNTTTQLAVSFSDAVLLNSREIDVQGDNLFNLIELGSSGWCVPYAGRMFYGLQLNKINNWTSGGGLTFDSGYLPASQGGNIQPLGWSVVNPVDQTLITSVVTGMSLYIQNQNLTTQTVGTIYQTAYQDTYGVAIIKPNTLYSVRVACSAPSGKTTGALTIDLTTSSAGSGFGTTAFGTFSVPLTSMSTVDQVFSGTLLTSALTTVPTNLVLRVYLASAGAGADCAIDRIEVFETATPYLKAQVYGSYIAQPEAIDASSTGGVIDTTTENAQPCMGGFVMRNLLYILKTNSWYSTQDNPNSEPGGWGLAEVSNKVGAIGIHSYDVGEEWVVTACRAGIFGFNGGQPTKIMQELWNLWEQINWDAGNTIVLRNDIVNKRMYIAIPLPTGRDPVTGTAANKYTISWLPNAPYNPAPTSPNVMLMLNYQGLATFDEMVNSPEVHTTMFGTLAAVDMKRKWAIWNIATPAMEFIIQPDAESAPIYICNGIGTSKIYQLDQQKYSDDGVAINSLYTTYGFVNAAKAATLPIFGFHAKRYTVLQTNITGGQDTPGTFLNATNAMIRILPNTLNARYPYTVPVGIPLVDPAEDDYFRAINVRGNRAYVEISTNAVGSYFNVSKLLLTGKADPWATLNPTGGGNAGIV